MKKYIFTAFLLVFWCVAAIFENPFELILIAGFTSALGGILFIKNRLPAVILALAVIAGVSIYNIDFLTRLTPSLLLVFSYKSAAEIDFDKKKNKSSGSDLVYTLVLLAGLLAVGTLINDVLFYLRNPLGFSFSRMFWIFAGIFVCFVLFVLRFAKTAHKTQAYRVFMPVYACSFLCFIFSAVGFLMNFSLYSLYSAFFPWLIFLALIFAAEDTAADFGIKTFFKQATEFLGGK